MENESTRINSNEGVFKSKIIRTGSDKSRDERISLTAKTVIGMEGCCIRHDFKLEPSPKENFELQKIYTVEENSEVQYCADSNRWNSYKNRWTKHKAFETGDIESNYHMDLVENVMGKPAPVYDDRRITVFKGSGIDEVEPPEIL